MTNSVSQTHQSILASLNNTSNIGLKLEEFQENDLTRVGIRPILSTPAPAFLVALSASLSTFEATLIHDLFSGDVIRRVSDNITEMPELWAELHEVGHDNKITTVIMINGFEEQIGELPDTPWRSLEVECSIRVQRRLDSNTRIELMAKASQLCLNYALVGLNVEEVATNVGVEEGVAQTVTSTRYERSRLNRKRCIEHYGLICQVCDLDFGIEYGKLGSGYIEVHHITPLSEIKEGYRVDPIQDLIPLCSNCHSMIHRDPSRTISPQELKDILLSTSGTRN